MTTKQTGPLQSYNSLTDEYLIDYFNNRRIRKHLRNMGLITKKGEVVDEPTFRYNAARKDHRSHVKDLMSQAVINKTLELERNRRAFIRDKLIEIRKIETVNRVKRDRDRGGDSDLGLRPKSAPSKIKSRTAESECMAGVNIPPGSQVKWVPLIVPPSGSTPYLAPLIPGYSKQPKERPKSAMIRSKTPQQQIRIAKPRPKSAVSSNPSGVASSQSNLNSFIQRRQIHSMSRITLRYLGKSLDLSPGVFGDAVEVLIMQQHCGGNTVCVYQGLISPNECFTFTSRRHRDAPFGITIYIGSLQDTRLSTCCEYKHKPGFILGGKSGHFSLVKVDGCLPCYKCFAHVDEFKKQQTEAHTKFQQSVREKQNKPLKKKKKKGKKEKKQSSSSSDSSADESSKPILDAKVSIKAKEEPPVPPSPPRSPPVTPHHKHEIVDISEDDMRQFEKLVIKSDNLDDEEDALVLQSSASDSEDGQQVEPISSTQDKQTTEPERIFSTLTTHINGYDKDIFDSDDDKKSDISDVSNKSLTSIKSNSSNKSEASTKSNSSSKSDKSNASSVKSSKSSSSSKSSASSSSIKSDKDDNSSISSIKSEDSLKDDHTTETEGSVTPHQGSPPPSGSSAEILEPEVPSHSEPEASPKDDLKKEIPPQTEPEKRIPPNIEPDVSEKTEIVPQTQPEDPVVDTPEAKLEDEGPPSSPTSTKNTSIARDSKEISTPVISDTIETNEVLEAAQAKDGDIKLDAGSESREGASDSDTESEMSIPSSTSETTTNHATGDTLRAESKILSPAQSILSTDSSRNKDPNRHIRFSETVIQRVASDDEN